MKSIVKAYKFRLYPTKEQENRLAKSFGCSRFVYNYFLSQRKKQYEETGKSEGYYAQAKQLTELKTKEEFSFLKEQYIHMLQGSLRCLETAYTNFFQKRAGFPNFKSKKSHRDSFLVPDGVQIKDKKLYISKYREGIKVKAHRDINGKILHCSVSKTPTGKYFVAITAQIDYEPMKSTGEQVGIDLGVKDLVITSDGAKYKNNKYLKRYEAKLKLAQKHLSRKQKGSRGHEKQRLKVALLHEKIANCRADSIHKITHDLIKGYDEVYMEDLNIAGMVANHKLAQAILDSSFCEITRQIKYKAEWNDRVFYKIDRFYPSSQTCNVCKTKNPQVKNLNVREWICPKCNTHHDRDVNAAKNILAEGIRENQDKKIGRDCR